MSAALETRSMAAAMQFLLAPASQMQTQGQFLNSGKYYQAVRTDAGRLLCLCDHGTSVGPKKYPIVAYSSGSLEIDLDRSVITTSKDMNDLFTAIHTILPYGFYLQASKREWYLTIFYQANQALYKLVLSSCTSIVFRFTYIRLGEVNPLAGFSYEFIH